MLHDTSRRPDCHIDALPQCRLLHSHRRVPSPSQQHGPTLGHPCQLPRHAVNLLHQLPRRPQNQCPRAPGLDRHPIHRLCFLQRMEYRKHVRQGLARASVRGNGKVTFPVVDEGGNNHGLDFRRLVKTHGKDRLEHLRAEIKLPKLLGAGDGGEAWGGCRRVTKKPGHRPCQPWS